ncbi:MAG: CehA/McbA family metallohydrolase [Bacteroidales bacterium]|nr:CehA/McbA family metallohydrolase [Bacteroidales bacterium]
MKRFFTTAALLLLAVSLQAQTVRHPVIVPDIPGYVTLKGDLHIHTMFSDGQVWPVNRVNEAYLEGLDYIAITDHLETKLRKQITAGIVNGDRDKSYEMARDHGKGRGIIVIHGAEITRGMPPGHFNATFTTDNDPMGEVSDAEKNNQKAMLACLEIARSQGAFLVWNHPNWSRQAPQETKWFKEHTEIYERKLMDGIEIFNGYCGYAPEAHHWAVEKGLTIVSGTDSHQLVSLRNDITGGAFRPMNLTFATERSEKGIHEALKAGRNAVFADDRVYGPETVLRPLLDQILKIEKVSRDAKQVGIRVHNGTSIPVYLEKAAPDAYSYDRTIYIAPGADFSIRVTPANAKAGFPAGPVEIKYKATNFFVDAGVPLEYSIKVD